MKENTKLILVAIIAVVVSSTISITATTMIQANSVSYKTSNGDTTDVNSALDRLFDLNTVNEKIGSTDIGDKTITGAISELNSNLTDLESRSSIKQLWTGNVSVGTSVELLDNISNYSALLFVARVAGIGSVFTGMVPIQEFKSYGFVFSVTAFNSKGDWNNYAAITYVSDKSIKFSLIYCAMWDSPTLVAVYGIL